METSLGTIFTDKYEGHSFAPGYRDIDLKFLVNMGEEDKEMYLRLSKADCLSLLRDIIAVHCVAWDSDDPIDFESGEIKPVSLLNLGVLSCGK